MSLCLFPQLSFTLCSALFDGWPCITSSPHTPNTLATPSPSLLPSNPYRDLQYVMTNCAEKQARECLELLGVAGHFEHVYGADWLGSVCKPEEAAFRRVCDDIGCAPQDVVFFEDSYKNLVTAHKLGMATVMVKGYTAEEEGVSKDEEAIIDAVVPSLSDLDGEILRAKFPALFVSPC